MPLQPPRPPNSWVIYLRDSYKQMQADGFTGKWTEATKLISPQWHALPPLEKAVYKQRADEAKREHEKKYIEYKFKPGVRKAQQKQQKERAREKKLKGVTCKVEDSDAYEDRPKRTSLGQLNLAVPSSFGPPQNWVQIEYLEMAALASQLPSSSSSPALSYSQLPEYHTPPPSYECFESPYGLQSTKPTFTNPFVPSSNDCFGFMSQPQSQQVAPIYSFDDRGAYDQSYWAPNACYTTSSYAAPVPSAALQAEGTRWSVVLSQWIQ